MKGDLPKDWRSAIGAATDELLASEKELATRQASGIVLNHLFDAVPELLGGSADLTPIEQHQAKTRSRSLLRILLDLTSFMAFVSMGWRRR